MASDGRFLLSSFQAGIDPWWVAVDDNSGKVFGHPQPLMTESAVKSSPACSRDGRLLAYVRWAGLRTQWRVEVHVRDLRTGRETVHVGSGATLAMQPRLSADGSLLAYADMMQGKWESYIVPEGTPSPREVCDGCTIVGFLREVRKRPFLPGPAALRGYILKRERRCPY